jgi:flagellar biosynthesis/type III secretory pathway protein FliH
MKLIVPEFENTCIYCGSVIPEGSHVCPNCLKTEAEAFEKAMSRKIEQPEFKPDDINEQAFRQGYTTGFSEGMKTACEIKQENEQLKRRIIILEQQASKAVHDIDSFYE